MEVSFQDFVGQCTPWIGMHYTIPNLVIGKAKLAVAEIIQLSRERSINSFSLSSGQTEERNAQRYTTALGENKFSGTCCNPMPSSGVCRQAVFVSGSDKREYVVRRTCDI